MRETLCKRKPHLINSGCSESFRRNPFEFWRQSYCELREGVVQWMVGDVCLVFAGKIDIAKLLLVWANMGNRVVLIRQIK